MLTLGVAIVVSLSCTSAALQRLTRFRRMQRQQARGSDMGDDFEQRLEARARSLFESLSRRMIQALSRVALASGTGLGIFELTNGVARVPWAVACFAAGAVGWIACQELVRRFGSKAGPAHTRPGRETPETLRERTQPKSGEREEGDVAPR